MRLISTMLLLAGLLCSAAQVQAIDPNKLIGAHDKNYNYGKVFDLPQGEQALYVTVVTHDQVRENSRDAQVLAWFDRDPRLNRLKKQSNFNHYWQSHPHYATEVGKGGMGSRFGQGFPTVSVQRPDGEVLFFAAAVGSDGRAGKLPKTAAELGDMVYGALDAQLKPQQFQSHSSSPAASGITAEYPCPPNQPYCPDETPPNNPGPPLPEYVPDGNPFMGLFRYWPLAVLLLLMVGVLFVVMRMPRPAQAEAANTFFE